MILIILCDRRYPVSKRIISNTYIISYPYFNDKEINKYIDNYINSIIGMEYDYLNIYYDVKRNGNYIITFYIYLEKGNLLKRVEKTLIIGFK